MHIHLYVFMDTELYVDKQSQMQIHNSSGFVEYTVGSNKNRTSICPRHHLIPKSARCLAQGSC